MEIENEVLFQIIAVLLYKLGNPHLTLTEQDLNDALQAHNADRLILHGINGEMHVGIYNNENQPLPSSLIHSFH